MEFEWDERKNKANILKHGIDFNEAREIFETKNIYTYFDLKNYNEDREISIGPLSSVAFYSCSYNTIWQNENYLSKKSHEK